MNYFHIGYGLDLGVALLLLLVPVHQLPDVGPDVTKVQVHVLPERITGDEGVGLVM